ncbi:TetR family transcriptional regulator [Streptomyces sulfonofaciens]|uniref:TetR family transcriptional regulator n=1 Tax=Streptomyces sulfonofaciens TaxID=68272 RepID=A0A919KZ13_9ACTN|nr:TetR family transcriptional regulator [Streptomyces sulfonofaciens]GHH78640.1 TetR family transcriptional regulator [Streptomyces sulfonofaciens]
MPAHFQRARNEEQRAVRRQAILDTAAAMLTDMPVAEVSLNALSRRVCLAKSNVLRYFESREEILLELLDAESRAWLDHLARELPTAVGADAPPATRGDGLAAVLARSLATRPVLCDLISAQAAVLERNVSPAVALTYKRAALANAEVLAGLVRGCVPELDERGALRLAGAVFLTAGSVWTHAHPSSAVRAAYEADPALAEMRLDFTETLQEVLEVFAAGLLARRRVD